jgi:hypothetical protein
MDNLTFVLDQRNQSAGPRVHGGAPNSAKRADDGCACMQANNIANRKRSSKSLLVLYPGNLA